MADSIYTASATLDSERTFLKGAIFPGDIHGGGNSLEARFTVQLAPPSSTGTTATFLFSVPTPQAQDIEGGIIEGGNIFFDAVGPITAQKVAITVASQYASDAPSNTAMSVTSTKPLNTPAPAASTGGTFGPAMDGSAASSGGKSPGSPGSTQESSSQPSSGAKSGAKSGVSPGAVAGGVIGGLVAGAILAALLVFLCMRRRNKRRQPNRFDEKVVPVAATAGGWEGHLPQPESDTTIQKLVNRTLDSIEGHVDSYYRNANAQLGPDTQSKLLALETHHLSSPLVNLLSQTTRPTTLIKHCIAALIVSEISTAEGGRGGFLPRPFTSLQVETGLTTEAGI